MLRFNVNFQLFISLHVVFGEREQEGENKPSKKTSVCSWPYLLDRCSYTALTDENKHRILDPNAILSSDHVLKGRSKGEKPGTKKRN